MVEEIILSYYEENSALTKYVLDTCFFHPWKNEQLAQTVANRDTAIELYITADCNQKCEYCYLIKNGDELYPKELRNLGSILHNLDILLDYLVSEHISVNRFDIFSGEIMHTSVGVKVLEKLLDARKRGLRFNTVVIPTNYSFLFYPEQVKALSRLHKEFLALDVRLSLSASVDGLLLDTDTRPINDNELNNRRDQEFYDRAFQYVKDHDGGFHPMVSAYSVSRWIENTKWWIAQCEKYDMNLLDAVMMLEVRNPEWTSQSTYDYCKWLEFLFDWAMKHQYKNDVEFATRSIAGVPGGDGVSGYIPYRIHMEDQIPTCSIAQQLTVRLGDLAIVPCHRTSYEPFIYGRFTVENEKITGIEGTNPFIATKILMMNHLRAHHGCDTCWNKFSCIRQCFGAQYEANKEIFAVSENVCDFLKEKTNTILKLYDKYGITDKLIEFSKLPEFNDSAVHHTVDIINRVREGIATDMALKVEEEEVQ